MKSKSGFLAIALAVAAAGCGGGTAIEYRDALVIYRGPVKEGTKLLMIGFVNTDHGRYIVEGNVRSEIPAVKPLKRTASDACLERLADLGYPEAWVPAADLNSALATRKGDHVIVAEVDRKVHVFIRGGLGNDLESLERRKRFGNSKQALIMATLRSTGFRVIQNKQGAKLFEKQMEELARESREGRK